MQKYKITGKGLLLLAYSFGFMSAQKEGKPYSQKDESGEALLLVDATDQSTYVGIGMFASFVTTWFEGFTYQQWCDNEVHLYFEFDDFLVTNIFIETI